VNVDAEIACSLGTRRVSVNTSHAFEIEAILPVAPTTDRCYDPIP
jgi:hypothetical protein